MVALRRAFVGASIVWAAGLPLATFAASRPPWSSVVYALTFAVYAIGSVICHQRPDRSFHLWSHQMPVCARCTGIYLGSAIAAVGFAMRRGGPMRPPRSDTRVGPYGARAVLALAALPTIATLVYEWTTGVTPANAVRALAGLPLGAAVSWIVIK
jgi:hypothetical protein